jgi:hypothetical protein
MEPPVMPPPFTPLPARLPMSRIVWHLFFQPATVFFIQFEPWRRAFRLMALFALGTGLVLGALRFPQLWRTAGDWSTWLGREVGALEVRNGELRWDEPKQLPYTTRHQGWRLDFVPGKQTFAVPAGTGPEKRGIWIAPDSVYAWWLNGAGKLEILPVLTRQKLWGVLDLNWLWPDGIHLAGDQMPTLVRDMLWKAFPFLLLQEAVAVFLRVLFYTVLFAFIPVLLRTPFGEGGFRRAFAFYCFASVPPLVVAGVYAGLDLPFLDYDAAFVLGFVIYLFMVTRGIDRAAEAVARR